MHFSANGLHLIEQFEGFSPTPYWDPDGRVWTRGYGETEGIGPHSPRISQKAAQARLQHLVESRYEPAIRRLGTELTQNQWDALCSFVWNLGTGIFTGQLRAALQEHQWEHAAEQMRQYDHAGGVVLAGLQRRREIEARLFLTPDPPYMPHDEIRWEHEYDQIAHRHGPWARVRRRALQRAMRARLLELVHAAAKTGWDKLNRKDRYHKLLART
jgi:lysozyme